MENLDNRDLDGRVVAAASAAERAIAGTIITQWSLQNYGASPPSAPPYIVNPAPSTGSGVATPLGMNNNYTFPYSPPTVGSQDGEDVLNTPGSSSDTGNPLARCLRI